jgi:hypothetical protein
MVDVSNRSDVAVRLRAREFFLGHGPVPFRRVHCPRAGALLEG